MHSASLVDFFSQRSVTPSHVATYSSPQNSDRISTALHGGLRLEDFDDLFVGHVLSGAA